MPPPEDGQQSDDNDDDDNDDDNEPTPTSPVGKALAKLLNGKNGKKIYKTLKERAAADDSPGSFRTAWGKNEDFRFDVGHLDLERGVRHWEFQVNKGISREARDLLKTVNRGGRDKASFHTKLFEDVLDIKKTTDVP